MNSLQHFPTAPCPCGRVDSRKKPSTYALCCGRYVEDFDNTAAPNAEHLMRSRYTAFVLQREAYLLATWAVGKRPSKVSFDAGVKWLGLEVRAFKESDSDHATVEFVARQREGTGRAIRLHEHSRFVRDNGRWYYLDGDIAP